MRNAGLEKSHVSGQPAPMEKWAAGYSQSQLNEAQERYAIRFPPDLIELFLEKRPVDGYSWEIEDERIRKMLAWPLDMLLAEIDNGYWWKKWGHRPKQTERHEIVRDAVNRAPRLIPLIAHRFIPENPSVSGNPIFSMYGFDTIYYGANLMEYFANEFAGTCNIGTTRHIEFWSDITEGWEQGVTGGLSC